jgi:hypothetical protein
VWGEGRGSAGMRGRWRGWSAPGPAPAACLPPLGSDYTRRQTVIGKSMPSPVVRRCYGTTAGLGYLEVIAIVLVKVLRGQ